MQIMDAHPTGWNRGVRSIAKAASGQYLDRIETGDWTGTRKMTLIE